MSDIEEDEPGHITSLKTLLWLAIGLLLFLAVSYSLTSLIISFGYTINKSNLINILGVSANLVFVLFISIQLMNGLKELRHQSETLDIQQEQIDIQKNQIETQKATIQPFLKSKIKLTKDESIKAIIANKGNGIAKKITIFHLINTDESTYYRTYKLDSLAPQNTLVEDASASAGHGLKLSGELYKDPFEEHDKAYNLGHIVREAEKPVRSNIILFYQNILGEILEPELEECIKLKYNEEGTNLVAEEDLAPFVDINVYYENESFGKYDMPAKRPETFSKKFEDDSEIFRSKFGLMD